MSTTRIRSMSGLLAWRGEEAGVVEVAASLQSSLMFWLESWTLTGCTLTPMLTLWGRLMNHVDIIFLDTEDPGFQQSAGFIYDQATTHVGHASRGIFTRHPSKFHYNIMNVMWDVGTMLHLK